MMTAWQKWSLVLIVVLFLGTVGWLVVLSSHDWARQVRDRVGLIVDGRQLTVRFFSIGQGDAALITLPNGDDILVDGGPDDLVAIKIGRSLPWYDREIERIIITHPHSDHIAGLLAVLRRYRVREVITTGVLYDSQEYRSLLSEIDQRDIPIRLITQPEELTFDQVKLQFLRPEQSLIDRGMDNLNNASIVFRLVYGESELLMTGDYEDEETLIGLGDQLDSDLLKSGHHGSSNANDRNFIKLVDPDYAVVSVGAGNRYGHPDFRTLYNLEQAGAKIFRTDLVGDVVFRSLGQSWQIVVPTS